MVIKEETGNTADYFELGGNLSVEDTLGVG